MHCDGRTISALAHFEWKHASYANEYNEAPSCCSPSVRIASTAGTQLWPLYLCTGPNAIPCADGRALPL